MYRFYVKGNMFYLEKDGTFLIETGKNNVDIKKYGSTSTKYRVVIIDEPNATTKLIDYAQITGEGGVSYTDQNAFDKFIQDNTGKYSLQAGGLKNFGFFDYNDLATSTTPINVIGGGGFVYLTNDELGSFTNKLFPPKNITDVWDSSNNEFDLSQLPLGSKLDYRLDIEVTTTSPNQEVSVDIEIAIGGFSYSLGVAERQYKTAKTHKLNVENFIYIGDLNTKNNKAKFKIESDSNATVKVNGWACYVFVY